MFEKGFIKNKTFYAQKNKKKYCEFLEKFCDSKILYSFILKVYSFAFLLVQNNVNKYISYPISNASDGLRRTKSFARNRNARWWLLTLKASFLNS